MKNKNLLILVLLLISFTTQVQAQFKHTVSGYVRDSLSLEPLVGINISISPTRGTHTNEYGFFSLIISKDSLDLIFSSVAYHSKRYRAVLDGDMDLNILLNSSNDSLDEAVIHGKESKMVATRALGIYAIDSKQLNYVPSFMGEKDIFKYFQLLPGVNSGKEGSAGLNLRGGSTDETLILMDDIPIYNSAHAFGFISVFSGDYIKSAELYKGYIPSQYGGRLSGVATMNIREGNRKEHTQSLQLGTTTFSALLEGPINGGKGSYLVGGRYFMPDLLLRGAGLVLNFTDITYPVVGFYDLTAKISYDITKNSTIHGSFYTGRDAINFISNDPDYSTSPISTSRTTSGINWGNIAGSVRLSLRLSNKSFFNLTTYYSHLSNSRHNTYDDSDGGVLNSKTSSQMGEAGLKANMKHNVTDWYNLNYGLNLSYQHFVPQDVSQNRNGVIKDTQYGARRLYTGSLFLDNQFRFGDFSLNAGGRVSWYNNDSENKIVVEPRTSLTYYMPKSSLWLSYTMNSQPLFSINQMTSSFPLDYWVPFHSAKELPTSEQLSLGYKKKFDFGLEIQAETYYKKSKNLSMVYNIDDFLLDEGGYELATGDAYGAEFLAQYSYKRFNIMASYTYSKSLRHIGDKTIDFVFDTPHNLNVFASFETLRRGDKTHTLSANVNYKTGVPYIFSNTAYPMEGAFSSSFDDMIGYPTHPNARLTNFFRVDLNYTMEKKLKKGSRIWQISILNATAHRNPYMIYYKDNGFTAFTLIPFMPSFSYTRKF